MKDKIRVMGRVYILVLVGLTCFGQVRWGESISGICGVSLERSRESTSG
jgi:hypothetical protein